jgi:HSP20 family protein
MSWLPARRAADRDPLLQLQNDINQMFDRWLQGWGFYGNSSADFVLSPAMDIDEDDTHYYVHMDLPGVDAKDVSVAVENGALVISGEKREERKTQARRSRATERVYGRFYREVSLPSDADTDHLKAQLKRGVLTVTVPKTSNSRRRAIPVEGE